MLGRYIAQTIAVVYLVSPLEKIVSIDQFAAASFVACSVIAEQFHGFFRDLFEDFRTIPARGASRSHKSLEQLLSHDFVVELLKSDGE